jgi:hypothetical protein
MQLPQLPQLPQKEVANLLDEESVKAVRYNFRVLFVTDNKYFLF